MTYKIQMLWYFSAYYHWNFLYAEHKKIQSLYETKHIAEFGSTIWIQC